MCTAYALQGLDSDTWQWTAVGVAAIAWCGHIRADQDSQAGELHVP